MAFFGLYLVGGLENITFGLFDISNIFITSVFAFLLIIWFINLTNFIDGINGYVGSEFVFLGLAGLALFGAPVFAILIVSVLGFLLWNYNKAKIFMGDVGSTLLGYTIAIFTIYWLPLHNLLFPATRFKVSLNQFSSFDTFLYNCKVFVYVLLTI